MCWPHAGGQDASGFLGAVSLGCLHGEGPMGSQAPRTVSGFKEHHRARQALELLSLERQRRV